MTAAYESITGRYLRADLIGKPHRVYVEEAGTGVPLLCLHTAGSDTRQWRGLMNDDEITERFRVVTFDLPWHGKSSPPEGWHELDYVLSSEDYISIVMDMIGYLALERPIVMGCSIGGRLVLHLALEHPEVIGALVGLQAGAHSEPYYDLDWLHRPDVHGGEICAAIVSGLIAPGAPSAQRWETLWHYAQSGPGVFKGDLNFYGAGGDLRARLGETPDTCPLFLLTGEYDYSCTPEDTLAVAEAIPHAVARIMPGLGHFPMSENYEAFRPHLLPVLDAAAAARAARMGGSSDASR